jgi:hypothetical protein
VLSSDVAELAWAAGIMDGEGCITIQRNSRMRSVQHRLAVKITMTHRPTIDRLKEIFSAGSIAVGGADGMRKTYSLWITQKPAGHVLEALLPFLVTKADEAVLALKFLELPRATPGTRLPSEWIADRERYYQALRTAKMPSTFTA